MSLGNSVSIQFGEDARNKRFETFLKRQVGQERAIKMIQANGFAESWWEFGETWILALATSCMYVLGFPTTLEAAWEWGAQFLHIPVAYPGLAHRKSLINIPA